MLIYADGRSANADVCGRMLTFADVCLPQEAELALELALVCRQLLRLGLFTTSEVRLR